MGFIHSKIRLDVLIADQPYFLYRHVRRSFSDTDKLMVNILYWCLHSTF